MKSKMLILVLALVVSVGFALSGCKGGGSDAAALCNKMSKIRAEAQKDTSKEAIAESEKECLREFDKLPANRRKKAAHAADEAIKSCSDKPGEEFKKCIDSFMANLK